MSDCVNCFSPIQDKRKSVTCSSCGAEMHKECAVKCFECGEKFVCDTCLLEDGMCATCKEKGSFPLEVVRRSYLETYKKCPYQFYLSAVKKLGNQQTIYTQSGIDLHELFDEYSHHSNGNPKELFDRFISEYEQFYPKEWYREESFKRKMHDRYEANINGFFELRKEIGIPIITEERIVFSIGEKLPKLSITMDRIDEEDGEYVLGDYKTGKVMVGKKLTTDLQAPLYIYAVKEHYGKPVKRMDFYYLGEGKKRSFTRLDEDKYVCLVGKREYVISLRRAIEEARAILNKMVKGKFDILPTQKPYNCTMCQFKDTHCDGCDVESWGQINRRNGY